MDHKKYKTSEEDILTVTRKKALSLNLEFLVRIVVFALVVFALAYMILGKDFLMKMEGVKTHKRLVNTFIEVAKNYEKYNYSYRYGGKINGDIVICEVPYENNKPCGIQIILPEEINIFSTEVLPALGDPNYIIYWDKYDNVEWGAWSGWVYFDALFTVFGGTIVKGIGKGCKIAGKFIIKFGKAFIPGAKIVSEAAELLGKGIAKLGNMIIRFTGGKIKIGDKKLTESLTKEGKFFIIRSSKGDDIISALDDIAKGLKKEGEEEAAKAVEEFRDFLKKNAEEAKNWLGTEDIGFVVPSKKSIEIGEKVLQKIYPEFSSGMKKLIDNNQAWICSFSGAVLGITSPQVIIETLKNAGYISHEDAEYYYFPDGTAIAKEIAQTAAWSLLLRKVVENGKTKMKTLIIEKDTKTGNYIIKAIDVVEVTGKDPEDWIVYEIYYDSKKGELNSKELGKVREILNDEKLKMKTIKNCFYSVSITFAPIFIAHMLESKYETVKGEAEKCKNAVCIKGPTMSPTTYKKEELIRSFKESKICGIKIMNAKRNLEIEGIAFNTHNFYLASPCFAYAQFWVGDCEDPKKPCNNVCSKWYDESGECTNEASCCRRCIWVSLQEGKLIPLRDTSQFNFCTLSPQARGVGILSQMPWPWAGYWWPASLRVD